MSVKMTRVLDLHQRKANQRKPYGCETQEILTKKKLRDNIELI